MAVFLCLKTVTLFKNTKGGEIYDEALGKGIQWKDEGGLRQLDAEIDRKGIEGILSEGREGPDVRKPEGPETKVQIQKGFDQR
jgi:hypothetical protein